MLERAEQKYFVAPARMSVALALVRRTCRWDEEYPEEQINSLYFDTADLDQHENSLAGEYAKDKIRIRWYGEEHDPHRSTAGFVRADHAATGSADHAATGSMDEVVPVWLELKSRRGFASTKQRKMVAVPAEALTPGRLTQGIVPVSVLMQTLAGFGFFTPELLQPVIAISYWRRRFVEPRSGFRVAYDSRVRSTVVAPGIGRGRRGLELPGAVVEVKGPSLDFPPSIWGLAEIGSSWTRYSKYSSCLDAHNAEPGSVSWLWPSGVVHAEPCTEVPTLE